jgi:nucleotide-binding universal stress UspA family protein
MPLPDPAPAPRRILVALDGSARAEALLPRVEGLARATGATVTLLRVNPSAEAVTVPAEPSPMVFATRATIMPPDDPRNAYYEAEHYLDQVVDRMRQHGVAVEAKVARGTPGEAIVAEAEAAGADLIAMTTHGRGGLDRALFGSVADEVLRHTDCPILLVRVSEPDEPT